LNHDERDRYNADHEASPGAKTSRSKHHSTLQQTPFRNVHKIIPDRIGLSSPNLSCTKITNVATSRKVSGARDCPEPGRRLLLTGEGRVNKEETDKHLFGPPG
jgi:hypothetical protein